MTQVKKEAIDEKIARGGRARGFAMQLSFARLLLNFYFRNRVNRC